MTEGTSITVIRTISQIHPEGTSQLNTNAVVAEAEASKSNPESLQKETTSFPLKGIFLNISLLNRNDLTLSLSLLKSPNGDGLTRAHNHNQI
jgi:hypothetical protein